MADIKISDLVAAASASGAMQLEVNDGGVSRRVTVDQVKAYAVSDGSITSTKLATDAVTSTAIASGAVTTTKIADGAVTSLKIADGNVTVAKLTTGAPSWTSGGDVSISGTGFLDLPVGTTAQRPGTPSSGMVRFNSSLGQFEGYSGTAWGTIGGGATGGGADQVFYENAKTITTNYTLTTNKNAMSTGPITVNSGVSVTVPSGARWVIL